MRVARRIVWALLATALVALLTAGLTFWIRGYQLYVVRTGSMAPTYPTGSLVLDEPSHGDVAVGQVVTFRTPSGLVTHRVHARKDSGIETKGDANRTPDAWSVAPRNVIGQVTFGVAHGGYVLVFLQQPAGVMAVALLGLSVWIAGTLFFSNSASPDAPEETVRYHGRHRMSCG